MSGLYLGVDAGNTKTDALVCDASGRVHGYGRSGGGDIYNAGVEPAVRAVLTAVREALTRAGTNADAIAWAAFRLAGVDWPEDHALWTGTIQRELPGLAKCTVANDGFGAIRCGEPSGIGVAVVVGTGAAVVGRGPDGTERSLSFWIEDGMGAGGLVHDALHAVCRAELGLGPATDLTRLLLAYFEADDVEDLLHRFTRREGRPDGVATAAAAPTVSQAAGAGDAVAAGIVADHAARYAGYARVAAYQAGFDVETDRIPVVLSGSVLTAADSPLRAALQTALAERFPTGRPRLAQLPPVGGAALDALAEAGIPVADGVIEALGADLSSRRSV